MSTQLKQWRKANFVYALLVGIVVLATCQLSSAQVGDCSSLIAGRTYASAFNGFLNAGTEIMPNAGGQYMHFNADGTLKGVATFSVGTFVQIADLSLHGTYQVAWDNRTSPPICTGHAYVSELDQNFQLVVNGSGGRVDFMHTDYFLTVGFTAVPMQQGRCSSATLKSTYTYNAKGWITPPPLPPELSWFPLPTVTGLIPFAFSGAITFDGHGGLNGWDTVSLNGLIVPRTYTGEYNMGANCVSTQSATDTIGNFFHTESFVLQGGKGLVVVNTDLGTVLAFTATRATDE